MPDSIIVADHLTKAFTSDAGVFELDLDMGSGNVVGLIGPSGSGKTTTVRLMIGVLQPDSGSIRVFDKKPTDFDTKTRARIGYMPQESVLYPELTLHENLDFAASMYGMPPSRHRRISYLSELLEIEAAMERMPAEASGGEKRRLMLATTLVHDPELLFLDEPTAGIDPVLRRKIWDHIAEVADEGRTLIVTTQYVGEAAYCDYVAVLAKGRILTVDTPEDLRRRAFGGEFIDVVFEGRPTDTEIESLRKAVDVQKVEWLDQRSIRLLVNDAGLAGPKVNNWSSEMKVDLLETESHVPPFDDVFVALVEALTVDNGLADGSEPPEENGVAT